MCLFRWDASKSWGFSLGEWKLTHMLLEESDQRDITVSNVICLLSNIPTTGFHLGRKASRLLRKPSALVYLEDECMADATGRVQEGKKGIFGRSIIINVLVCIGCFNSFVSALSHVILHILQHPKSFYSQSPSQGNSLWLLSTLRNISKHKSLRAHVATASLSFKTRRWFRSMTNGRT